MRPRFSVLAVDDHVVLLGQAPRDGVVARSDDDLVPVVADVLHRVLELARRPEARRIGRRAVPARNATRLHVARGGHGGRRGHEQGDEPHGRGEATEVAARAVHLVVGRRTRSSSSPTTEWTCNENYTRKRCSAIERSMPGAIWTSHFPATG